MTDERREYIKDMARKFKGMSLDDIVDGEELLTYSSIDLKSDGSDESGVIICEVSTGKCHIFVHEGDHKNRKRFTLAHELGHYFLHKERLMKKEEVIDKKDDDINKYNAIVDIQENFMYRIDHFTKNDPYEVEANFFAAELLMPEEGMIAALEITKDMEELARIFSVSQQAIIYRLNYLGLPNDNE